MSLWTNPPHTALVYPVIAVDDGYGGTQPGEGEPVEVRCLIQPRSAGDPQNEPGWFAEDVYEMAARSLPAGAWSRVTWNGEEYTVVGEPRRYGVSRRTAHDVAALKRR